MAYSIRTMSEEEFPSLIREIPDPPQQLFCAGQLPPKEHKLLAIVGARQFSEYGKSVCEHIIEGLRGYPISIVSGLALGIDSIAHRKALSVGLHTIAIPGSGLDKSVLYPRSHTGLAEEIVQSGGALISEFENTFRATPWAFPKRNRIMAGISHAVLVIEAEQKSGTLITSRLATEYNRDVCVVPGSIFSRTSEGPHMLLRLGATPITKSKDILEIFNLEEKSSSQTILNLTDEEQLIVKLLTHPLSRDELIRKSKIETWKINSIVSAMEMKGLIVESMGELRLT